MAVCNYDGDYRFADGSPTLVGKGITSLTDPYDTGLSVGFDNGNALMDNISPDAADSFGCTVSCWANFSITDVSGLTCDPTDYGEFFGTRGDPGGNPWFVIGCGAKTIPIGSSGNSDLFCDPQQSSSTTLIESTYLDLASMGWVHVFGSNKFSDLGSGDWFVDNLLYVNDTLVWHSQFEGTWTGEAVAGTTPIHYNTGGYNTNMSVGNNSGGSYALAELWVMNQFIDPRIKSNRYLFHKYENGLYKAIDIGARGQKPGFGNPVIYMTGGPSAFRKNRTISGGTATFFDPGFALLSVSSTPF